MNRRSFLAGSGLAWAAARAEKGEILPADRSRYADPATEFEVVRLTDAAYSSRLAPAPARTLSSRSGFVILSSDRTGSLQGFRMELRSGEWRQITQATALDWRTLTMTGDERSCFYFDGPSLRQVQLSGRYRDREVYRVPDGFERRGFAVADDGRFGFVVEYGGGRCRLKRVAIIQGTAVTVLEAASIADPQPRPRREGVLYRGAQSAVWLVNYDGQQNRRLRLAEGAVLQTVWSPDGRNVEYINVPGEPGKLNTLREFTPDANEDRVVAPTSQFVSFGGNSDGSVFVGASGSKASPHVLLLLRVTRRELTLCEHKATDPAAVNPVFAPSSQRIYFNSDRHGKPAIYTMSVERLVEKTET